MAITIHQTLCRTWWWDTMEEHKITFHEDGTGEILSYADFNIWLSLCVEWNYVNPAQAEQVAAQKLDEFAIQRSIFSKLAAPEVIAEIPIEFRITKKAIPRLVDATRRYSKINDTILFEGAFDKRTIVLTLRKGVFITQWNEEGDTGLNPPKYRLSLTFSPSPYPDPQDWNYEVNNGPKHMQQWKMTRFCTVLIEGSSSSGCVVG